MRELIFVVNPASGGRRGGWLLTRLRDLAAGQPVVELAACDLSSLAAGARDSGAALIACGGDGSAAAVLEAAWQAHVRRPELPPPPVGVIPLGTGNDLARSLGWAGAAPGDAGLTPLIARLRAAEIRGLDRWLLSGPQWQRPWFNYWSVGIDARIARRFHRFRHRHPVLCRSRLANQALYAGLGAVECPLPLASRIGHDSPAVAAIPAWASAMVVTSIASYAGGARLSPRIDAGDGCAEVFALAHGLALGLATAGLRRPRCLGRVARFTVRLRHPATMQLDGEPLAAATGVYRLSADGRLRVLAAPV